MEKGSDNILGISFFALCIVLLSSCGKQSQNPVNYFGKSDNEKQFTVTVVGVESFSCSFDGSSRVFEINDNDVSGETIEEIQPEEKAIPQVKLK